jgi:hypothetical protein
MTESICWTAMIRYWILDTGFWIVSLIEVHRASSIEYRATSIKHRASSIKYRATSIKYRRQFLIKYLKVTDDKHLRQRWLTAKKSQTRR